MQPSLVLEFDKAYTTQFKEKPAVHFIGYRVQLGLYTIVEKKHIIHL